MIFLPAWMADLESTKYTSPIQIYAQNLCTLHVSFNIFRPVPKFLPTFFLKQYVDFWKGKSKLFKPPCSNLWSLVLVVSTALIVYVILGLVQYPCIETTLLTLDDFKFQPPLTMIHSDVKEKKNNNLNIKIYSQYTSEN